jgi:hypothetical protein
MPICYINTQKKLWYNQYQTFLEKLIEEESVEYFVGHVIFAISKSSKGFLSDQSW